jgi:hypothetical protein
MNLLGLFPESVCSSGMIANQNAQLEFSKALVIRKPDGHAIEIEQK